MDFRKHQPIYIQIADVIFEDILQKKIKDGDRIPSVRDLAIQLQVNPNTVQRTFQWLQDESIIEQKRGIGFFLCDTVYHKTLELKKREFIQEVLPETIKQMKLLGIDLEDIKMAYLNYQLY
ncbi:MAG TPA: GntR family transcriptional regulator [Saprospiraceae bacterium]|nr:GntR family transcriptional regulator [Saprospiraceae bacterium]